MKATNNITHLRENLFEAMELLKTGKIDVSQAKAMAEIGQVIVNTAKAETDHLGKYGGSGSGFIPNVIDAPAQTIQRVKGEYSNKGHQAVLDKYAK